MTLVPLFAALSAAGALIRIPFAPVPLTLQTLFVIMAGLMLGPRLGLLSQAIYLIVGLIGFPVFSGGGGLAYIMKPSFGYLLGFLVAPVVAGLYLKRRSPTRGQVFVAALLATMAIYLIGVPYLAFSLTCILHVEKAVPLAIQTGLLVFLPGDLVKCVILALSVPRLKALRDGVDGSA